MKWSLYSPLVIAICAAIYGLVPLRSWCSSLLLGHSINSRLLQHSVTDEVNCDNPAYTVRVLSYDPLMIHLENFFTNVEREHLLSISSGLLKRSSVTLKNGTEIFHSQRTSRSAFIPRDDTVARCIHSRVSEFQGFVPIQDVERLQITAYQETQEYRNHYDWFGLSEERNRDRITTFFGILEADCDNCGTHFPHVKVDWHAKDERWCRLVDCSSSTLTVRPVVGSALFWTNLYANGTGDKRMLHAGQPLSRGIKTGLNIWTQQEYAHS